MKEPIIFINFFRLSLVLRTLRHIPETKKADYFFTKQEITSFFRLLLIKETERFLGYQPSLNK